MVIDSIDSLFEKGENTTIEFGHSTVTSKVKGIHVKTTNYIYDNINGVITLTGDDAIDADNKTIDVSYSTVIYGLDINTEYYYKAYIKINEQKKSVNHRHGCNHCRRRAFYCCL